MLNLKILIPSCQKTFPKNIKSRHNEQPNTLTRQEFKDKIYVKNIRKKLMEDPTQDPDPDPKSPKM